MASNTGPDITTYQIPEVELGDTFNTWRDITNTAIYKLNKIRAYEATGGTDFTPVISSGGTFSYYLSPNIQEGHTFLAPITFSSGVTFNGPVTFNADTFTVNANNVTIDDYNIVLGSTGGAGDSKIDTAGGGGLLLHRGTSGPTAEWVWSSTQIQGITGYWRSNTHIGFSGSTNGIYPHAGGELGIYGRGIKISGGNTSDFGIGISLGTPSTSAGRTMEFHRFGPRGSTAFAEVISVSNIGNTYPFFNIRDGANRKTVRQTSHGFVVGNPVRMSGAGYTKAQASNDTNSEVIGIVSRVYNANEFELTFLGEISIDSPSAVVEGGGANLTAGSTYYLSPYTAGKITTQQPTTTGLIHKAVLIATGTKTAVVIPFTGGLLAAPIATATSTQNAVKIYQYHKFIKGDFVRFRRVSGGITLSYETSTPGISAEQNHPVGIYFKAQATTDAEAEVLGMVIDYGGQTGGVSGPYQFFDLMVDGFYNIGSAIKDKNGADLVAGDSYFLNINCAGTVNSGESGVSCLASTPPSIGGSVNKPLLTATASSGVAGVLHSFRGTEVGAVDVAGSSADITRLLITDLRDGVCGDLEIGHYDGSVNGREAIRVCIGDTNSAGLTGNVGIWGKRNSSEGTWTTTTGDNSGNRVLAALDVMGTVRAGLTDGGATIRGCDLLVVRGDGAEANTLPIEARANIGKQYTTGNIMVNYGVRGGCGDANYYNSMGSAVSLPRSSLVVGVNYNADPSLGELRFLTSPDVTPAANAATTLTEAFRVTGLTAYAKGGLVAGNPVTANPAAVIHASRGTGDDGLVINVSQNTAPYGLGMLNISTPGIPMATTALMASGEYDHAVVGLGFQSITNQNSGTGFTAGLLVVTPLSPRRGTWISGPIWQGAHTEALIPHTGGGVATRQVVISDVCSNPSVPAGVWTRIGVLGGRGLNGQGRFSGRFTVNVSKGSYHQNITFYAAMNYGSEPIINVLNQSRYAFGSGHAPVRGIRIVRLATPTYSNSDETTQSVYAPRAVEILLDNTNTNVYQADVSVSDCGVDGFVSAPFTTSVPGTTQSGPATGFDKVELVVNPAGMGSRGEVAFEAIRTSATPQTASGIFLCNSVGTITGVSGVIYNTSTGKFTAPTSGVYRFYVWALVNYASSTNSSHYWRWYVNDGDYYSGNRTAHSPHTTIDKGGTYFTLTSNINIRLGYGDTIYPFLGLNTTSSYQAGHYNSWGGNLIQ